MRPTVTVIAIVCLTAALARGDMLRPWTTAETDLFSTTDYLPGNVGSGWFNNTLILNYAGGDGSTSGRDGSSSTDEVQSFVPSNAIGISFGVSATTELARVHVWVQKLSTAHEFIFQHSVGTLQNDMDFSANVCSLFSSGPEAVSPIDYSYDIPETTLSGITTVEFLFIEDFVGAPVSRFRFAADSRDPAGPSNNILLPGTTTFSDVSWIISDGDRTALPSPFASSPNPVPLPGAALLGMIGLGFAGWRLRRQTR